MHIHSAVECIFQIPKKFHLHSHLHPNCTYLGSLKNPKRLTNSSLARKSNIPLQADTHILKNLERINKIPFSSSENYTLLLNSIYFTNGQLKKLYKYILSNSFDTYSNKYIKKINVIKRYHFTQCSISIFDKDTHNSINFLGGLL